MNETTPPIMTINDELLAELERLAIGAKGWNMPIAFQEPEEGFLPEDWEWHVGTIDEDDIRYPLLHVNAHQYDSDDSEKLARYYAAVNRDTILALLQHVRELKADAERLDFMLEQHRKIIVELIPGRRHEVYVTEGFMGDEIYPVVIHKGDWVDDSQEAKAVKRAAIDAARSSAD